MKNTRNWRNFSSKYWKQKKLLIKPPEETGLYLIEPEELEKLEKFLVKVLKQRLKQKKTPVPEEVKSLESLCELEK